MSPSLEVKALRLALLAAQVSVGGAWLAAVPIKWLKPTGVPTAEASSPVAEIALVTSPELVKQGRSEFTMSCVECHGDDAHGDEGPDLHHLAISNARDRGDDSKRR